MAHDIRPRWLRMSAVLGAASFTLLALLAGCPGGPGDGVPPDSGVETDVQPDPDAPTVITPRADCGADTIEQDGDVRCASCDEDDATICGQTTSARCVQQENALGEPCSICVADDGTPVFDSCAEMSSDFLDVECRLVERTENGETMMCELCTAPDGRVVSQFCHSDFDDCAEVVEDGLRCTVCTADGELAWTECVPDTIEPTRCVSYGDENGTCTDCFDDDGALMWHDCDTFGGGALPATCFGYERPDGMYCEECYDEQGNIVEAWCDEFTDPEDCSLIVMDVFSCGVCTNEMGDLTYAECLPNQCLDFFDGTPPDVGDPVEPGNPDDPTVPEPAPPPPDDMCAEPVPCEVSYNADGVICAECVDEVRGIADWSCADDTNALVCSIEVVEVPIDTPGARPDQGCAVDADCPENAYCGNGWCVSEGDEPPPPDVVGTEECLVCRDANGDEVYSECSTTAVEPPQCFYDEGPLGLCEVCIEPATGDVIYNSCEDQECVWSEGWVLTDTTGNVVMHPEADPNDARLATASCEACVNGAEECTLDDICVDADINEWCNAPRVRLAFEVTQCANPWGQSADLMVPSVMGWALSEGHVVFAAYVSALDDIAACEACDCPAGQVLNVIVTQQSAIFFEEQGFVSPNSFMP